MKKIVLLLLIPFCVFAQKDSLKLKSMLPEAVAAACPQTVLGCNFNNWPNPLKGSTITYPAPVNGNCYDGNASTSWNCITTRANQTWFYVKILTSGNIRFVFNNSSNVDVDGVLWGPIPNGDLSQACSISQTTPLLCDYNASPTVELPCTSHSSLCGGTNSGSLAVQAGQVYLMCILNYANRPTNITLVQPIGGSVYYSQESQQVEIEHFAVNNGDLSDRKSLKNAGIEDSGVFKVCADGAVSSLFKIKTSVQNLKARITQDPNSSNTMLYGSFSNVSNINGVYEISYRHPDYLNNIYSYSQYSMELYSQDNPSVLIASYPIRIHPAPFLMVHGLWSNGTPLRGSCFETLESELNNTSSYKINTNVTETKLFIQANYRNSNDATFISNSWVVPDYLNRLRGYLLTEGYAVSKFDVLGHSMGGILARQYLQSVNYRNNIHKLITLNTPHSGSQMANFLSNPVNTGDALCQFIRDIMTDNETLSACQSSAINDLKVNSAAISTLNNGTGLIKVVPSHAIATTFPLSAIANGLSRVPKVGLMASLINVLMSTIFNNESNDLVVALSSQQGGLPSNARSYPSSFTPHSSQSNYYVKEQIFFLLGEQSSSSSFTLAGFNPPRLDFFAPNVVTPNASADQINASINIVQPANNAKVNVANYMNFSISGSNITEINVAIDYDDDEAMSYKATGSTANFSIYIDEGFTIGKHNVLAIGKLSDGSTVTQKISFEVVNCVTQYNPLNGNLTESYYQAKNVIITTGQVPFGQNINMSAGKSITINPGFMTDPYAIFTAKIENCGN
ncbi:esterase/lipase family protein [Emticicia soli]|uniref:Esterase/lipase family protein n=1 Tax=Emticicia soli TaxID=2027878 RepID=A0ABW5J9C0_9BACT